MNRQFNDATRAQIEAARPDASTWLSANAGSGKTRVLTDRVARLLLNGVEPQQILCLTYTKAAASEMQNRLFKRLGHWAMLSDAELRGSLADLGIEGDLAPSHLRHARTLFARAIETPGGLKIQTIHSFCASLLRRFPLEAGVSPQFTEIEDRAADLLRAEIVDLMSEDHDAPLIADIARFYTGEDFGQLTRSIVAKRDAFAAAVDLPDLLELLGQPRGLTRVAIETAVFQGDERALFDALVPALLAKGGNDAKAGQSLADLNVLDFSALPTLQNVLLTGPGAKAPYTAKIGTFPTKPTREAVADLMDDLNGLMDRVQETRDAYLAFSAAEKSLALHRFAHAFLHRYEAAKQRRGWLDFDDLILRARALLSDKAVAAWVLYRIDGGVDHILVDEAQDTSPRQWDVIGKLAEEFYSGDGAREVDRTVFVVGDKKQSIYSFQGADPQEFDRKADEFEKKITAAGQYFQHRSLDYSFRSSSAILRMVDTTFDARLMQGFEKQTFHKAFKDMMPGRIDVWPVVEKAEKDDERDWTDPVDRRSAQHHTVVLAAKIAAQIKELTTGDHYIPDDSSGTLGRRRIRAGDFLILVQRRSPLFSEIIRACKAAGLPIAGADRLKVGAELAVRDLAAVLSFLATPDDDLSLATALKSPLFGWSEQMLFDLAHRRTEKHLWQALRKRQDAFSETIAVLRDLRAQVDFLRPYDLIERILTRHGGRSSMLSRLGPEAEDGINAMLVQALAYERSDIPSLTGFLEWMQTDDLEIKRQIDSASDQVRVMTVHGAKGLEAPIVILPDTGKRTIQIRDEIVELSGVPVWKPSADAMPDPVSDVIEGMKKNQVAERLRLLYVAMTRAEKWLIIAAAGELSKDGSDWYQIVNTAIGHINGVPIDAAGTIRFSEGGWDDAELIDPERVSVDTPQLDPVFHRPAALYCHPSPALSPSDLGGAKALSGEAGNGEDAAKSFGTFVHGLLETYPELGVDARRSALARIGAAHDPALHDLAHAEALSVLETEALAELFLPGTLSEVAVTGVIGTARLHGVIDRLIVTDNAVLAVDFKTNRVVPQDQGACPEGLLRQMGAYALMLADIYPDHKVQTAILWTMTRQLMPLANDLVTEALWRSPHLDVAGMAT